MKSGHDTDYQDDIHLLLQRLCTASDSVPKEQRFELGQGWSKMFIKTTVCLKFIMSDIFHSFTLFYNIIAMLSIWCTSTNEITHSLLSGKANHKPRSNQVTWESSTKELCDRATKWTLPPWMPAKCFNSRDTLATALSSYSLWHNPLTAEIKSKTPPIPALASVF